MITRGSLKGRIYHPVDESNTAKCHENGEVKTKNGKVEKEKDNP